MTCRDCIHCNACHEMWLIAVSSEDDFFERNDAETCEDFKNKADFVEVVFCKDCAKHEKGCPLDTHPYMTPNDGYCYKGKRRDT